MNFALYERHVGWQSILFLVERKPILGKSSTDSQGASLLLC